MTAAPLATSADEARYRWLALATVITGTFVAVLDTSIVNVALPQIGKDFGSLDGVEWIVTAYLLAVGVAMTVCGWLADRFGRKAVFIASLVLFVLGSLLCATATSTAMLVAYRVLQGLGGGALVPVGMAIIYELFDVAERGRAMGVWGVAAMAAPAAGPVVGGWLVTTVDWRWMFLVNVPIGIIAVVLAVRVLREQGERTDSTFDAPGLLLGAGGVVLLLLGVSEGDQWGWGSPATLGCVVIGALMLVGFVAHALRSEHPLLDVRILTQPVFAISTVIVCLISIAQYARLVFIPLELEAVRGLSALHAGVLLVPFAIGTAITMPIGGRMVDRIGGRVPVTLGLGIVTIASIPLAFIDANTPDWLIGTELFVAGIGTGVAMMPSTVSGMNAIPTSGIAQASSWRALSRQLAGAIGVAVLTAVLTVRLGALEALPTAAKDAVYDAFGLVYAITAVIVFVGFLLGFLLPGRDKALELQAERRREGAMATAYAELE